MRIDPAEINRLNELDDRCRRYSGTELAFLVSHLSVNIRYIRNTMERGAILAEAARRLNAS